MVVLDADGGPLVGPALLAATGGVPWTVTVRDACCNTLASIEAEVDHGRFHLALVASPGASAALLASLGAASVPYDPASALTYIYDEGRISSLAPLLRTAAAQIAAAASGRVQLALLAHVGSAPVSSLNLRLVAQPVGLRAVNLHPVMYQGESTAAGISIIDLWVITLAATTIMLQVYDKWDAAGIRRDEQVLARITHELLSIGFISLWHPVTLAGLGAEFSARQFFSIWAFTWLFMSSFGLIITALFRGLGPSLGALVHTIFLILNLVSSTATTPMELMPPFFRIGYGLPFYNAVSGMRTIVFGSYDHLRRNCAVLLGWVFLVLAIAASRLVRGRHQALREIALAKV